MTSAPTALDKLTDKDFAPCIRDRFSIVQDEDNALELLEVSPLGSSSALNQRCPFSLLFRGPRTDAPEQGMFHLHHDDLGELGLFLVPVAVETEGTLYEAVFT